MTAIPFEQPIHYPESDGRPMAESELHRAKVRAEEVARLRRQLEARRKRLTTAA